MPSRSREASNAAFVAPAPWSPFQTFVATKTSSRGTPLWARARPTPASFWYTAAVSMFR